jgi:hypothetical protein
MAGLVPAIHVFDARKQDVDARHKAGHDAGDAVFAILSNVVSHLATKLCQ